LLGLKAGCKNTIGKVQKLKKMFQK